MVRLHLLGESPEQFPSIRRPFAVPPSPFAGLLKQFTGGDEEEPVEAVQNGAAADSNQPRVQVLEDDEENDTGSEAEPKKTK